MVICLLCCRLKDYVDFFWSSAIEAACVLVVLVLVLVVVDLLGCHACW
jgi:hypothetical protein